MQQPRVLGRSVPRRGLATVVAVLAVPLAVACSTAGSAVNVQATGSSGTIDVVAAENFWGSIASQLGGKYVHVTSIITNPNTDPHSYEPTAADARAMAGAQLVVENGIGYDPWVARLLAANGGTQPVVNVGAVVGVADGGNPHRWYNPADVRQVVSQLTAEYRKLDPADAGYFDQQRARFENASLRPYESLIKTIRLKYAGTPVGASESIFAMLAPALGLKLITPASFLKAISEGTDVSAADKQTIDNQIKHHLIKIYVYNSQNVTPDVQAQLSEARAAHIPITTITETLTPPHSTYQAWQVRQLRGIEAALATAVHSTAAHSTTAHSTAKGSR